MRRFTRLFLVTCLMLLCSQTSWADFKNFSVQVNNQAGTLLTAAEQTQGTQFSFGVAVAADGTVSRVETTDASSVATVSGKFHSDHGATELSVVVPVDGNVKITVGQCTYSPIECSGFHAAWPNGSRLNAVDSMQCGAVDSD